MEQLHYLTKEFSLSKEEESVFLCLLSFGEQTVSQIGKNSKTRRTTVYGILNKLLSKHLVIEIIKNKVKTYKLTEKENIKKLLDQKIQNTKHLQNSLDTVFSSLSLTHNIKPEINFFSGKEGVQFVLNDLIIKRNIETESFWPIEKMLKVLGKDYFKFLNKERIKRNIYTRAIWPESQVIDTDIHPYLGSGEELLREIRVAPKHIDFSLGYWIYENNVAFISSNKETYAFIVRSEEFAQMMKTQWSLIWQSSKQLKQKPSKAIQKFLKEI
jgi:sugar-specific transcriptional regulator TrmB